MSKLAKSDVRYHLAKGMKDQCGDCKWFERPSGCELVKGTIQAEGWCKVHHAGRSGVGLVRKQDNDRAYIRQMRGAG